MNIEEAPWTDHRHRVALSCTIEESEAPLATEEGMPLPTEKRKRKREREKNQAKERYLFHL